MQKIILMILILTVSILAGTGSDEMIQIGTFNIRFFPCNEDGAMLAKYDIRMSHPPEGEATDTTALFNMLKELDIEVLGVEELVDPPLFGAMAKRHLGDKYEFAYAPSNGWQKVGFLYNSEKYNLSVHRKSITKWPSAGLIVCARHSVVTSKRCPTVLIFM